MAINSEHFKNWNERMIKKYDPDAFHHHPNPFVRFTERRRVKSIFKLIDVKKIDQVLEIGCGAGNVIEKASTGQLFGVDISSFILSKAKKKLDQKVNLFQSDALNLSCKHQIFTRVICSEVLEHLLDPGIALHEMARILKPDGIAIVSVPNEFLINRIKGILIRLGIFKWLFHQKGNYKEMPRRMEDEWHLHAFRLNEWRELFERYFIVIRLKKIPFFWIPLRYVIRLEKKE